MKSMLNSCLLAATILQHTAAAQGIPLVPVPLPPLPGVDKLESQVTCVSGTPSLPLPTEITSLTQINGAALCVEACPQGDGVCTTPGATNGGRHVRLANRTRIAQAQAPALRPATSTPVKTGLVVVQREFYCTCDACVDEECYQGPSPTNEDLHCINAVFGDCAEFCGGGNPYECLYNVDTRSTIPLNTYNTAVAFCVCCLNLQP